MLPYFNHLLSSHTQHSGRHDRPVTVASAEHAGHPFVASISVRMPLVALSCARSATIIRFAGMADCAGSTHRDCQHASPESIACKGYELSFEMANLFSDFVKPGACRSVTKMLMPADGAEARPNTMPLTSTKQPALLVTSSNIYPERPSRCFVLAR